MPDEPETGGIPTTPPADPAPAPAPAVQAEPSAAQGPDPAQLAAQLLAARTAAQHKTAELAAYQAAVAAGADADRLLDSRSFVRQVRDLDPHSDDFAEKVKALVQARQGTRMTAEEPTAPETGAGTTTATAPDPQPQPTAPPGDGKDLAAEVEKWKHFSRKNEEDAKTTKAQLDKQAETLKLIAEKAGIQIDDGAPPDPAKLAAQLETANQRARQKAVELAVYRAAGKHEADADALLDSRGFANAVADLDPDAADFGDKVAEAIKAAVEANPRYKAAQAAAKAAEPEKPKVVAKSGGEFNGSPGGNRQWTDEDVARATPQQVVEAMEAGLMVDLGFNPAKPKR